MHESKCAAQVRNSHGPVLSPDGDPTRVSSGPGYDPLCMPPYAPPQLVLPRGLIFLASIWLIVSWGLTVGFAAPVQPSSASYTPGVRLMFLSIAVGCLVAWPMLRLSQPSPALPGRQVMLDLLVLLSLQQIVIWPLGLLTPWMPLRTVVIDLYMMSSTLLTGAVIAFGIRTPSPPRRLACMAICLFVVLAGPAIGWCLSVAGMASAHQWSQTSPLVGLGNLALPDPSYPTLDQWVAVGVTGIAAFIAWIAAASRRRQLPIDAVDQQSPQFNTTSV